ncbi:39 kDa initiator binding protein [Tritrichomonas foetus]|uniref:39 kDa initiator binding protein n=1 Tax=Tritrichomonas foetus TaxID=1144522 RepID=A0A1J4KV83_9EUKA|nr:39 kDa initiator binding protein [Tritrichomonas foetus]|eukprot:OHT13652.1 39 kDa initiator binding protein [Tritrichomonas foetus]
MMILPLDLQSILKRKSSRDPSSRFSSKLHLLLSFVLKNTEQNLEDIIGCAWVNEEEFKLNKKQICLVLGIKLNTLNVNLHALGFIQQKHNKDGWTLWKRPGFTRSSPDIADSQGAAVPKIKMSNPQITKIKIGKVSPEEVEQFNLIARKTWAELNKLNGGDINYIVKTNEFIHAAACRFKQQEQPLQNAIDVLQAIIAPNPLQDRITFPQFAKFLAMFGPENTIMLKIASLLSCSNQSGQWLFFGKSDTIMSFYGTFNDSEPNCLELFHMNSPPVRIWNMPLTDANGDYIRDEITSYLSWEDYFQKHPVNIGMPPISDFSTY